MEYKKPDNAKEKWMKQKGLKPMTKEEIEEIARCRLSR